MKWNSSNGQTSEEKKKKKWNLDKVPLKQLKKVNVT